MADVYNKEKTLLREITPKVENAIPGIEVLALELSGPERFTVYIDHPQRVDHALCGRVTDVLRDYLQQYTIDVSSPGLERPLRTATDIDGRKRFKGEVVDASPTRIRVSTDGNEYEIPYDSIVRGNLIEEGVK